MKFGIVLPTYLYSNARRSQAWLGLRTLMATVAPSGGEHQKPVIMFIWKGDPLEEMFDFKKSGPFDAFCEEEPVGICGTEQPLAWGTEYLFQNTDITHSIWMGDDTLVHPHWLIALATVISNHPDAKAWSVYRSAYLDIHKFIEGRGNDCLVQSLCGHGLTMTREEWRAWNVNWNEHPGKARWGGNETLEGTTLDLYHVAMRPGERWCSNRSFINHTGKDGINCNAQIPEYGMEFVGDHL